MQHILYIEILGCLSEKGFSLDELVLKTKRLFEEEGMSGFIALLLSLFDEHISIGLMKGNISWKPEACCSEPRYEHHDRRSRKFRTSVGEVSIKWRRLRCRNCGKSFTPLQEFLGLERYQSKTSELEMIVSEVVSDQSYRRTSHHLDIIGNIPVPKSTAHRWVMESDCDELRVDNKVVDCLFVDGTGYKRRPEKGMNNRGELRLVLGVHNDGSVFPFGAWSGSSWDEIGKELRAKTLKTGPIAKLLISDGEPGLSERLAGLINEQQRCHWHTIHDLNHMLWEEKSDVKERRSMQSRLAGIIGIELPEKEFEKVKEKDKRELENSVLKAEKKLDEFISEFVEKGYNKTANYIRNAKDKLFTYVRFWLKYGFVSSRTSSMIERMMRKIGRRLKKIAFGWSEKGAAKMARIIIKRITSADEWNKYWNKRLRIEDNVILAYRGTFIK